MKAAFQLISFDQSTEVRPLCQYGSSEVISSCAWFTIEPKVLAAGMGMKYIRVYDTRGNSTDWYTDQQYPKPLHKINLHTCTLHFTSGSKLSIVVGYLNKGRTWTVHGPFPRKQDGIMFGRRCYQDLGHQEPITADPLVLYWT